ncbi:MAG: fused MFS/spermidine synthase [Deltaproteobacteria bacterium]
MNLAATSEPTPGASVALTGSPAERRGPLRVFAWIYFFSGFSSLVYQVVWQRALSTHFGVGPISTTVIVSLFMAGLGIGSYIGGAISKRTKDSITAYFAVELTLGIFGGCSLWFLQLAGPILARSSLLLGATVVAGFLLVPTILMGITFPLLTQIFVERDPRLGAAVSRLYFVNTLGAGFGAITSSVLLISFFGLDSALYVAAASNLTLAFAIQLARRLDRYKAEQTLDSVTSVAPKEQATPARFPIVLVFVTGFLAIGYQMVWFRMVGVLVKDSPYSFSGILATYLLGIAFGSLWVHRWLERHGPKQARDLYFGLQVAIGLYALGIVLLVYLLRDVPAVEALLRMSFRADTHPPKIAPGMFAKPAALFVVFDIFWWSLLLFFPATLCMGAAFPLAPLLVNRDVRGGGASVGRVYFLNVAGNVAGGIVTGFLLLPAVGSDLTLMLFTSVNLLFVTLIDRVGRFQLQRGLRVAVCLALVLGVWLLGFGRGELMQALHPHAGPGKKYFSEGVEGTVLTYVDGPKVGTYLNGQRHGGRPNPSFYVEAIEAAAFARALERVLFIGYGTGSTLEALLKLPELEQVVLVELNATLMENLRRDPLFQALLSDARIQLIIDDGRRYLLSGSEQFDLILLDPLRTATAYSNNLYSREFFALVSSHLTPGGSMMLWQDEFDILPRTVASVFPQLRHYNYFLLASGQPFVETPTRRDVILRGFEPAMQRLIAGTPARLLQPGDPHLPDLHSGAVNTDWKPRTEYYLGWSARAYFGSSNPRP